MLRLACVDLPALPLQLLRQQHADWQDQPLAVVDRDRPTGLILWVNETALQRGVRPGQRYSQGLALTANLRAGVIAAQVVAEAVAALVTRLQKFTPHVEPSADEPGIFWLDASGLETLYPSLRIWGERVQADLAAAGFVATVRIGFGRFGSYAAVKGGPLGTVRLFATPAEETTVAHHLPLHRLHLKSAARDSLESLGIRTVGELLRLPPAGLRRRLGVEVERLHRLASGDRQEPLHPVVAVEPLTVGLDLDQAERDRTSLLFLIKRLLDALLVRLSQRGQALTALTFAWQEDHREGQGCEMIRPAAPTLDGITVVGLVRLRLETLSFRAGVVHLAVTVEGTTATAEQLELFATKPRRDPRAAARAFAALRASFGSEAVVHPRLREGHLPEAQFSWEPIDHLIPAAPRSIACPPLVRRLLTRPQPLPFRPAHEPDGWLLRGIAEGPVDKLSGPYVISGGWWRKEIQRDYHFAELRSGRRLWIYFDQRRRRWFLHGHVA